MKLGKKGTYDMPVEIILSYIIGTLTGVWLSRSYWMTHGASRLYDILNEKGLLKNGEKSLGSRF